MITPQKAYRDLVLVGGGHSHALAIRMLAMKPIAGLRITLVSPQRITPYSGMLPGLVAGHYTYDEAHIDLDKLCQWAQVRFIVAEVIGLDPRARRLRLAGRPDLAYDVVSLDIGSQPELDAVPGAREFAIPVKPVSTFWERWQRFLQESSGDAATAISLVGGGAGSVELALSMAHALAGRSVALSLWCRAPDILPGYNASARRKVRHALEAQGVSVHTQSRVARVEAGKLFLEGGESGDSGESARFDALFWCTAAAPATWIADTGLPVDETGFLQVTDTLQSPADPNVFAAGDIASQINHPRPKAGVFAVRQAPALVQNLRNALLAKPLRPFRPQRRFLSLISLGERRAVAEKGAWSAAGAWVWRWKDRIDREFMQRFESLPTMRSRGHWGALAEVEDEDAVPPCGGCGAKLGPNALEHVLTALSQRYPGATVGPARDAVPVSAAPGQSILQSVDVLRELVPDPYTMGRIAALHALGDLYACGAQPVSALASITLPFSAERIARRDLEQILAGALDEFARIDCLLAGGHTLQGPELSVGFVVNGVDSGRVLEKTCGQPGDALVLTKPLGTGVVFAARMRGIAAPQDVDAAVGAMLASNREAASLAIAHGVHACTDVTGFGLAGHLGEMLGAELSASIEADRLPVIPGALRYLADGVSSTMLPANLRGIQAHPVNAARFDSERHSLLFDPQTSGGLLMACPREKVDDLLAGLHTAGYAAAAVIGGLGKREPGMPAPIAVAY